MTLKEVWKKLGSPEKFVAKHVGQVNLYGTYETTIAQSTKYELPCLTLIECHDVARKVQGGDGFPFTVYNSAKRLHRTLVCRSPIARAYQDTLGTAWSSEITANTYVCMAEGDEEIEIDQDGFTTEYPIDSAPAPKELNCPCSGWDLLRGHLPECPYSQKED